MEPRAVPAARGALEVTESADRLVVVRARGRAVRDIVPLAALFLVPVAPLTLLVGTFDDVRGVAGLMVAALVAVIAVLVVSGFLLAMQTYRRHRLDERLVLDRPSAAVLRGPGVVAAFADVARVRMQRVPGAARADRWQLALVLGAGEIAVGHDADEVAMRHLGERLARFLGAPFEEAP